jgi:hypothetical protein
MSTTFTPAYKDLVVAANSAAASIAAYKATSAAYDVAFAALNTAIAAGYVGKDAYDILYAATFDDVGYSNGYAGYDPYIAAVATAYDADGWAFNEASCAVDDLKTAEAAYKTYIDGNATNVEEPIPKRQAP